MRKIADLPGIDQPKCPDWFHVTEKTVWLLPGVYEDTCPTCGYRKIWTVR